MLCNQCLLFLPLRAFVFSLLCVHSFVRFTVCSLVLITNLCKLLSLILCCRLAENIFKVNFKKKTTEKDEAPSERF